MMGRSFSLSLGLLLWIYVSSSASAQEHWCNTTELVETATVTPCNNFMTMILAGYTLDRDGPAVASLSDTELQVQLELWSKTPETSPDCRFTAKEDRKVRQCCSGWGAASCDEPQCPQGCISGVCIEPFKCECDPEYVGVSCEDALGALTENEKYCYTATSCMGDKPPSAQGVVSLLYCCQSGGKTWGSNPGDCDKCPENGGNAPDIDVTAPAVVENDGSLDFRTCMSYGPNYYRTFDGLEFLFAGRCSYTLYNDGVRVVIVKMIDCYSYALCRKELTITLNNFDTVVALGDLIEVNGLLVTVTETTGYAPPASGVKIEKHGEYYYLQYRGLRVRWDDVDTWMVTLEEDQRAEGSNEILGLCGNFDANALNDMRDTTGAAVASPARYGNSWIASTDTVCAQAGAYGHNCRNDAHKMRAISACSAIWGDHFEDCHGTVYPLRYYAICMENYCDALLSMESRGIVGEPAEDELSTVLCSSLSFYSHQCAERDIIMTWRTGVLCPKDCPIGMEYSERVPSCPKTCGSIYTSMFEECSSEVNPGCKCLPNTFLLNSTCVPIEECPCMYQKKAYAHGDVEKMECNLCTCDKAAWKCEEAECSHECSVLGYQHIHSFDGKEFEFHGADCIYTLVELKNENDNAKGNLRISYTVSDCTDRGIKCIDSVTVLRSDSSGKEAKVILYDDYTAEINGVVHEKLDESPFHNSIVYVKKVTSLFMEVKGFGFRIQYDVNGRLYIILDPY